MYTYARKAWLDRVMQINAVRSLSLLHKSKASIVNKRGKEILRDSWFNKGTAFSQAEKDRLGLRGLIPPRKMEMQHQLDRFLRYFRLKKESPIDQYATLAALQDRNENLFYKAIIENIKEMAPIVYTPTVGLACQVYKAVFRTSRGMYFSLADRHECLPMVYNWPGEQVDIVVVTDGSRILGLGDLGVQGMAISIGKLVLYVAAGGINPMRTLPVCIDVGTNNTELLHSPLYLGTPSRRCPDDEYFELFDEFMTALYARWPNVLVQFEDIQNERAVALLEKYRHTHLCFNDDIQGTGAVTVAGIMSALRCQGLKFEDMKDQKFVVVGAGSAGIGVSSALVSYMTLKCGLTREQAASRFWIVDDKGLLTKARIADTSRPLMPGQIDFLQDEMNHEGMKLLDVVKTAKPTVILGLSGVGGLFTEEICREMAKNNDKPVIFAMSNPSSKAECTAETAFRCTEGRALFASGSPFDDVTLSSGKTCLSNQANNMFIFPGLGLGAVLGKCRVVSDAMILTASEALASVMSEEDLSAGMVYPKIEDIRKVSLTIAVAVMRQAVAEGNACAEVARMTVEELTEHVRLNMYEPGYPQLVYRPPGTDV